MNGQVKKAQEQSPDDWYTGEKGEGYYAKYWFISCIIVMVVSDLLSLGAFYGAYTENSQIVMIYSALMFVVAVYGAYDKYMKNTFTAFLLPLAIGIVGILYASLNHMRLFEGSTLPDVSIKYMTKTKVHSTPTPETYEEEERLKMPDP